MTKEQVAALQRAFGLGAAIVDWDVDYSLGRGVLGRRRHCLWTKSGHRVDVYIGASQMLSQTDEPDPDRPTTEVGNGAR